jgi:hypothetical protein
MPVLSQGKLIRAGREDLAERPWRKWRTSNMALRCQVLWNVPFGEVQDGESNRPGARAYANGIGRKPTLLECVRCPTRAPLCLRYQRPALHPRIYPSSCHYSR